MAYADFGADFEKIWMGWLLPYCRFRDQGKGRLNRKGFIWREYGMRGVAGATGGRTYEQSRNVPWNQQIQVLAYDHQIGFGFRTASLTGSLNHGGCQFLF